MITLPRNFEPMRAPNQPYTFPTDIQLPCIVSPKYDGIRVINLGGDKWHTSKFKPIPSRQAREYLLTIKLEYVDAELLVFDREEHKFLDYNDIQSYIMSDDAPLPGHLEYRLKVFDYFGDPTQPYVVRMELMKSVLDDEQVASLVIIDKHVKVVGELYILCDFYATNYEGAIIRNPAARYKFGRCTLREKIMWKYVLIEREEGIITGHTEHDIYPDLIGALLVNTDKWGTIRVSGRIDRSLSREFRQGKHVGRTITYEYKPHGMKDMPRQPRFVGFRDNSI